MVFDKDFAAIHGYLCSDGYVVRNPKTQDHKYYHIGLRNTCPCLLRDFQRRFFRYFKVRPRIYEGRAIVQNKEIYFKLTSGNEYYSDCWALPRLRKGLMAVWLRAYFDCDGWVSVVKAKDRKIGLDSINRKGLSQIREVLNKYFGICSSVLKRKSRNIWSLSICGKDDLVTSSPP